MNDLSRIRKPVKRSGAERYLRLTLLSFAVSVVLTRLFLALTGYPQVGGGSLHIAHVLWGGLLLFVASILPLILSNRWAYTLDAALAGVGVGLFIDEVGKFITQTNDYFYPAAAPIIYAFFLLIVLVYLQVRRAPRQDARTELYHALDGLSEVLDHDLDADEQAGLEKRLERVAESAADPELARLAAALLDFVRSETTRITLPVPGWQAHMQRRLLAAERRWVSERRLRSLLVVLLTLLGLWALTDLVLFAAAAIHAGNVTRALDVLVLTGRVIDVQSLSWFLVRTALDALVGLLFLVGAALLGTGRERQGVTFATYGLLLALTTVDLLIFYLDQFTAVLGALAQLGALLGVVYYRRRYVAPAVAGQIARDQVTDTAGG
jgi:hypothetical protein